jgi:hypothetical protein
MADDTRVACSEMALVARWSLSGIYNLRWEHDKRTCIALGETLPLPNVSFSGT